MSKLFHCEIEYMPSPHLMQLYAGFFKLKQQGLIDLVLIPKKYIHRTNPIINATIDKKHKVIYDTQDGLSWITGSKEQNLEYFKNNYKADFYFKRSYHRDMEAYRPGNCKIFPLGFNYNVHPDENLLHLTETLSLKLKYFIKTNEPLKKVFNKRFYYAADFEWYPVKNGYDKILFSTRVWDPKGEDVFSVEEKELREKINHMRISCLDACKKEFGNRFSGGLWLDDFSEKNYKAYTLPFSKTSKSAFLNQVKSHSICIATTGLFQSIGWKMGEYVAASRAIVSEKLNFELPGRFKEGENYFEFNDEVQLLEKVHLLLSNRELLQQMMKNNYEYYNNYLKPDILVLNTLLTISNQSE
mgnify:FL=1